MTKLEQILAGLVALLASAGIVAGLWISHNHAEQKLGAQQCIQTTTIDHTEAKADVASDQAAQAVDIKAVVQGYETKVLSLQHDNDDLAGRLLASGAVRPRGVPNPGSASQPNCPVPGLPSGESEAAGRSAAITQADLTAVLNAADANQVKTEDCAKIYNGVRERAIAAAAQLPKPP